MSLAAEPVHAGRSASLPLRYALRELRGGLRGFYVFIACIALGVMAISGVGSVAASLSEGLAHEGRTLLGGDVAFSLIQREAKPDEVAFLRARGQVSVAATWCGRGRAPATTGLRWSRSKPSTEHYRCWANSSSIQKYRSPMFWQSATARSARRSIQPCWRGST